MSKEREIIVWPVYFDVKKSRSEGRRVRKDLAIENPSAEIIYKAALRAGFKASIDNNSKHPGTWFEYKGRIIIYSEKNKQEVLRVIGSVLRDLKEKERSLTSPSRSH